MGFNLQEVKGTGLFREWISKNGDPKGISILYNDESWFEIIHKF